MRKEWLWIVCLALGGLLVAEAASLSGLLRGAEAFYGDYWRQLAGVRHPPERVVIVSVDDATLDAHPDVPLAFWSPLFARVLETLRGLGSGAVGLDILFSVTAENWLEKIAPGDAGAENAYDRALKEELARGDVVLSALLTFGPDGRENLRLPVREFYTALPAPRAGLVGLTNFLADRDGAVRHYLPRLSSQGHLALGVLLAVRSLGQDPLAPSWTFGPRQVSGQSPALDIEYCGPPGTFPRVSMGRLLAPEARTDPELSRLLAGKVVVVAVEHTGSQDLHQTPYSRSFLGFPGRLMSGPEVHANITESLLAGRFSSPAPPAARLILLAVFLFAATLLSHKTRPGRGFLLVCLLAAVWAAVSYACFSRGLIMPVAEAQIVMALCYVASVATRLTGEEKRRRRVQRMFGRYVSRDIVDQLVASGKMPDLGGELLQVTILFSDIRNFTTLSERMRADQVVEMLNAYQPGRPGHHGPGRDRGQIYRGRRHGRVRGPRPAGGPRPEGHPRGPGHSGHRRKVPRDGQEIHRA